MNIKRMQNRSQVINKLALVLLSIVLLELVLIGDQVQPVKAIKKKILVKKLKKFLPLIALIKPKKKIILVPIPIPMYKNSGNRYPNGGQNHQLGPRPMMIESSAPPMSFMMMTNEPSLDPGFVGMGFENSRPMTMLPMTFQPEPMVGAQAPPRVNNSEAQPVAVMMPSMTMTIQSEPGGNSAIELSTNMMNPNTSAPLLQRPGNKWRASQQQQLVDNFDEPLVEQANGGEQYYSWPHSSRPPLVSPAKLFRNERLRQPSRPAPGQRAPGQQRPQTAPNLAMPVVVMKNQWRPKANREPPSQQLQQQQMGLEYEELVPVGPPQMMPVYQTPNGQLHMSPPAQNLPPPPSQLTEPSFFEHEEAGRANLADEVQTIGNNNNRLQTPPVEPPTTAKPAATEQSSARPTPASQRLTSPAVKGKQQQQQQQQKTAPAGY